MWTGASPGRNQFIGAGVAFLGLLVALWPEGEAAGSVLGALFKLAAGIGWAAYTLAGRGAENPVAVTATHFLLSLPFLAVLLLQPGLTIQPLGWALAFLGGGITSGMGYAMWYYVLPSLPGARAAVVQLSVPVLAILLGALLLGEPIGLKILFAATLVIGGIWLALRK